MIPHSHFFLWLVTLGFFISWYVTLFCILSVRSFMEYLYMSIYFMECTWSLHHAYFPALVFSWLLSSTLFILRVTVKVWGATALLGVNVFFVDSNGELKLLWCSAFSVKTLKTMDFHKTRKTANPGKFFWWLLGKEHLYLCTSFFVFLILKCTLYFLNVLKSIQFSSTESCCYKQSFYIV